MVSWRRNEDSVMSACCIRRISRVTPSRGASSISIRVIVHDKLVTFAKLARILIRKTFQTGGTSLLIRKNAIQGCRAVLDVVVINS